MVPTFVYSVLLLVLPLAINGSFVTPSLLFRPSTSSSRHVTNSRRSLVLHKAAARDEYLSDEDNTAFDVEAARQRLEALLVGASDDAAAPQQQQGTSAQNREEPPPPTRTTQQKPSGRSFFDIFFGPSQPQQQQDNSQQQHNSDSSNSGGDYRLSPSPPSTNNVIPSPSLLDKNALNVLDKPLRDSLTQTGKQQPLTAMELERRQTEITLLSQLVHSDAALDDLWSVWYHERGLAGAKQIQQVEQLMANSATWKQAELLIRQLIQEHGTSWAEPMNRLATLFYMQGRLVESEIMCQLVLQVKPWHFGALSGVVMVYASLGKTHLAKHWAARRLPSLPPPSASQDQQQQQQRQAPPPQESNKKSVPLPTNRRRQLWVHTATEHAKQAIRQLESERDKWWGPADGYQYQKSQNMEQVFQASDDDISSMQKSCDEDENTWQ